MPTGMPAQAARPPLPAPPLPPIQRSQPPPEPADPSEIANPFERVAAMIVAGATDMATRLATNMAENPVDSHELTPDELKAMWYFSPVGTPAQADQKFWDLHDQILAQTGDPNQAEQQALQQTYPYRSQIAAVGDANAERQVQLAEQARKTVDGDSAPDSAQFGPEVAYHQMQIRQQNGMV